MSGKIAGVLTVIKPTINIAAFIDAALPHVFRISALSLAAAILLSLAVSIWVNQQVGRLTRYANDVRAGRRVPFPKLAPTELKTMGVAFEKMREALAGQRLCRAVRRDSDSRNQKSDFGDSRRCGAPGRRIDGAGSARPFPVEYSERNPTHPGTRRPHAPESIQSTLARDSDP